MIAVVDYGAGNLRSVEFALEHLEIPHRRAADPEGLRGADGIVLPGVGAAAWAMRELEARGLAETLRRPGVPLLGICLGMQLLTEASDEGERAVACLGLVRGRTRRFTAEVRLPHMGWNDTWLRPDPLFEGLQERCWFYYLHAHRVEGTAAPAAAVAEYGEPFPAALREGSVAGVQFHPEKSGPAGLRILANFARACGLEAEGPGAWTGG